MSKTRTRARTATMTFKTYTIGRHELRVGNRWVDGAGMPQTRLECSCGKRSRWNDEPLPRWRAEDKHIAAAVREARTGS